MVEINEEAFLEELAITKSIIDTSKYAYELTGDWLIYANEQLYAQMLGWA